jgi:hypothetical protein
MNPVGNFVHHVFHAEHPAGLVSGAGGAIEDRALIGIGSKGFAFLDADRRQRAAPCGIGDLGDFAVEQHLELVEGAGVARRQHVHGHAGRVPKFHRLGGGRIIEGIDLDLLHQSDGRPQILRVLI